MMGFGGWFGGTTRSGSSEARAWVADGALLLDVRTREEFAEGHLKGAVNIPVQELAARANTLPPPDRRVVVYCRSGGRSASAARHLRSLGYRVLDLGPMSAW